MHFQLTNEINILESDLSIIDEMKFRTMSFNEKIIYILSPMENTNLEQQKDGEFFIIKNGVKFASIYEQELFLLNSSGNYQKFRFDIETQRDKLLIACYNCFWRATGKKFAQ